METWGLDVTFSFGKGSWLNATVIEQAIYLFEVEDFTGQGKYSRGHWGHVFFSKWVYLGSPTLFSNWMISPSWFCWNILGPRPCFWWLRMIPEIRSLLPETCHRKDRRFTSWTILKCSLDNLFGLSSPSPAGWWFSLGLFMWMCLKWSML